MDHGWCDLLHHVGNEVELVPRAGQLVETCASRKNQVRQQDLLAPSSPSWAQGGGSSTPNPHLGSQPASTCAEPLGHPSAVR